MMGSCLQVDEHQTGQDKSSKSSGPVNDETINLKQEPVNETQEETKHDENKPPSTHIDSDIVAESDLSADLAVTNQQNNNNNESDDNVISTDILDDADDDEQALSKYDQAYHRHDKIERTEQIETYTQTLLEQWKHRKFHQSLYRHALAGYMDDEKDNSYLVIDVRDPNLDYPGGHIKGGIHIPHGQFVQKIPWLIAEYHSKLKVIIHCMYSQSRGPLCCRLYCMALECLIKSYDQKTTDNEEPFAQCLQEDKDFEVLKTVQLDEEIYANLVNQQVYLLKGGFRDWVNAYKDQQQYVEDFSMEHWSYELVGDKRELYHKNDW